MLRCGCVASGILLACTRLTLMPVLYRAGVISSNGVNGAANEPGKPGTGIQVWPADRAPLLPSHVTVLNLIKLCRTRCGAWRIKDGAAGPMATQQALESPICAAAGRVRAVAVPGRRPAGCLHGRPPRVIAGLCGGQQVRHISRPSESA